MSEAEFDTLIKELARGCVLRDMTAAEERADGGMTIDEEATYAIMKRAWQTLLDQSASIKDLRLALAESLSIIRRNGDHLPKWVAEIERTEMGEPIS